MHNIFEALKPVKQLTLEKDEYLFRAGDAVKYLYRIQQGHIRMLRLSLDGKESVMYEGGAGDTFAEPSLFSDHYHCDAVAVCDARLDVFDKPEILEYLNSNAQAATAFMAQLARQVQQLRTDLELRNIASARERIYQFVVLNADSAGCVTLAKSLKDLSRQLGLAHETFYRELARLEKDKLIRRESGDEKGSTVISLV